MKRLGLLFLAFFAADAALAQTTTSRPAQPAQNIRRTETIVDGNWTVRCAQTDQDDAKWICQAVLKINQIDKSGVNHTVFVWALGHQDGKRTSLISVPSGVQIPPGVEIKIGDNELRKIGYASCVRELCQAILPLEETMVKSLSAAQTADLTIRQVNGNDVKFTVNMNGFAQALTDLNK